MWLWLLVGATATAGTIFVLIDRKVISLLWGLLYPVYLSRLIRHNQSIQRGKTSTTCFFKRQSWYGCEYTTRSMHEEQGLRSRSCLYRPRWRSRTLRFVPGQEK
ncbi:hypothetical protein F5888DRAFT_658334 [Russula emetica]|nr:hypothetical protein F5888DRAFT_658334 [Russula emetica]